MGLFDDVVDFAKKSVSTAMAQGRDSLAYKGLSSIKFHPESQSGSTGTVDEEIYKRIEEVGGGPLAMRKDYIAADDYRASLGIAAKTQDKPFGPKPVSNAFGDLLLYAMGAVRLSKPPSGLAVNLGEFSFPVVGTSSITGSRPEMEEVAAHENVHMGQFKYGMKDIPSLKDVDKYVFGKAGESEKFLERNYGPVSFQFVKPLELGATLLSRSPMYYYPPTAEHIGNYLDLLYRRNPEMAAVAEAYAPPYVMKQYVQDRPRPLLSPAHKHILSLKPGSKAGSD
jgi:hypothetical protein